MTDTDISQGYHVQITARSDRDLTPEGIVQKVADASGSKYSAGNAPAAPAAASNPVVASKPVFTPTQSGTGSSYNPLGGAASRKIARDSNVDEDGWGADAPQVSRSQIEKVPSAYQPTKVNMAELTKQKQEPSRFNSAPQPDADSSDVVKGGYQPIGKVDIAAIRAKAKKVEDDRPTTVKGAYEPVGKVDIAAIRAKAQKPTDEPSRHTSPAPVKPSTTGGESDEPKSLSERSSAFQQSERLTSLPKPKVANKLPSSFTGTKPLTPGTFGLHSAVTSAAPAPVGAASRTFADEGGKTPAQIWAEKKAKERGTSGAAETHTPAEPVTSQSSGGGEWKSGYKGKSWAPVAIATTASGPADSDLEQQRTGEHEHDHARDEEEAPSAPTGGIGALKDRFKGAAPMGAPSTAERDVSPPPVPSATRPTGGVSMPGLPSRPAAAEEDEDDRGRHNIPSPPRVARSPTPPTPERDESPVRIAMPVSRGSEPHIEAPEERHHAPSMPVRSLEKEVPRESDLPDEPKGQDPARAASAALAGAAFGGAAVAASQSAQQGGKRAIAQYDYEKAEDNEIELLEGEYVTEIDMVDDDWWMGTNSKGESGLFPSNYVELVEDDEPAPAAPSRPSAPEEPAAPAAPAAPEPSSSGPTATAIYDYEAAEDNELSFEEDAKITDLVSLNDKMSSTLLTCYRNSLMRIGGSAILTGSPDFSLQTTYSLTRSEKLPLGRCSWPKRYYRSILSLSTGEVCTDLHVKMPIFIAQSYVTVILCEI